MYYEVHVVIPRGNGRSETGATIHASLPLSAIVKVLDDILEEDDNIDVHALTVTVRPTP